MPHSLPARLSRPVLASVPLIAWFTLAATLLITLLAWRLVSVEVREAAERDFTRQADDLADAVSQRMVAYEQVLHGGVGLFTAAGMPSRAQWRSYVEALRIEDNYPGIQGIGFSLHLHPDELAAHVREVRTEGFPDYDIRPAGRRAEYTAIIYLEPFDVRNRRAFGYDMFSQPTRRAAMEQARDTGEPRLSGKVILVQEMNEDIQAGFLLYLPLYRPGVRPRTLEQRREALIGYVYSPFRARDLMTGILGGDTPLLNLQIYDGTTAKSSTLMYDERFRAEPDEQASEPGFSDARVLNVQGRPWTLHISSTAAFESTVDYARPRIVAFSGILISLLFFTLVWQLATRRAQALALATDMTRRVREREGFINALVDNAADAIITIDDKGHILTFNHAAQAIFGYSEDEAIGRNVSMLMPEPHRSNHDGYLRHFLDTGERGIIGVGREVTGQRKDGSRFPLDLAVSEVRQDGGRVFTGIARDITERKRAEDALRRSEERFDLAIRGANDGLWDWDLVTDEVYYSPRWKEMLGYAESGIGSGLEEWRSRIHPDDLDHALDNLHRYLAGELPLYQSEHRMRHRAGHYLWILDRGIAQRDSDGNPYRMVGIHTDISQRKQVEKMKSEFISTVSHELRTPLTSIRGSLGLVAGGAAGELSGQAAELVEIATRNSDHLLLLINDLLDLEKMQSGNMQFQFEPGRVEELVERALEVNRGYAEQYEVRFTLSILSRGLMINVDPARFLQVMSNLLSNAAKFSPPGTEIEVDVRMAEGCACISVTDQGPGIAEEFRERIFDKFTQADSSDSRHKGGTGLGLNISKSLVEHMHGRIGFDTVPGEGTTFHVIFPLWQETSRQVWA